MAKSKKKKYIIRRAKPTDIIHLLKMMKEFLYEVSSKYPPVNDADCMNWMLSIVNAGGAWVAISEKRVIGTIGCSVDRFSWNRQVPYVYDEWYYVDPAFRKGYTISKELIEMAKTHSDKAGLPFIFSINSGKDVNVDRFVRMQGFEYMGGIAARFPEMEKKDG